MICSFCFFLLEENRKERKETESHITVTQRLKKYKYPSIILDGPFLCRPVAGETGIWRRFLRPAAICCSQSVATYEVSSSTRVASRHSPCWTQPQGSQCLDFIAIVKEPHPHRMFPSQWRFPPISISPSRPDPASAQTFLIPLLQILYAGRSGLVLRPWVLHSRALEVKPPPHLMTFQRRLFM